jgi:hypothetical protein
MIVFRQKYPHWWFDRNLEWQRFSNRVCVYLALMDDRYPSTDEAQAVHLDYACPDAQLELNRWLPLITWFLAIPRELVLVVLNVAAVWRSWQSGLIPAWASCTLTRRVEIHSFST